jgi:hypothetical protein
VAIWPSDPAIVSIGNALLIVLVFTYAKERNSDQILSFSVRAWCLGWNKQRRKRRIQNQLEVFHMSGFIIAENSAGAASKAKEVTLPVYADDLADNVRAGFDNTCVYIKDYTDALEERLNSKLEAITSRLDALMDNLINLLA